MEVEIKKTDNGLIVVDANTGRISKDENGNIMSLAQYFKSINHLPDNWTIKMKSDFIQSYGLNEYEELKRVSKQSNDFSQWSQADKSRYITQNGIDAFNALVNESRRKKKTMAYSR